MLESQKGGKKNMALPLIICMEASKYLLFLGPVMAPLLLRWRFALLSLIKYSAVVWSKIWKKSPAPSEKSSRAEAVSTTMLSTVTFIMARRKLYCLSHQEAKCFWSVFSRGLLYVIRSSRKCELHNQIVLLAPLLAPTRKWRHPFSGRYA